MEKYIILENVYIINTIQVILQIILTSDYIIKEEDDFIMNLDDLEKNNL